MPPCGFHRPYFLEDCEVFRKKLNIKMNVETGVGLTHDSALFQGYWLSLWREVRRILLLKRAQVNKISWNYRLRKYVYSFFFYFLQKLPRTILEAKLMPEGRQDKVMLGYRHEVDTSVIVSTDACKQCDINVSEEMLLNSSYVCGEPKESKIKHHNSSFLIRLLSGSLWFCSRH
jgi:hypothetical protein